MNNQFYYNNYNNKNYDDIYDDIYDDEYNNNNYYDYNDDIYASNAVKYIHDIEIINANQFPHMVKNYINKNKMSKNDFINEMKLIINSSLSTRSSIIYDYFPENTLSDNIYKQISESINNIDDPSKMITIMIMKERSLIKDNKLETIFKKYPLITKKFIKDYTI